MANPRRSSIHGQWSGRWAFILAATGSAVGLGNVWKFPYLAGEYGGGAFVLLYLVCVAVIGLPIMMAEIMLGRRGRQSPINTMRALAQDEGRSPLWQLVGWSGMLAGFLILSYYSVIGGWTLAYIVRAGDGVFDGVDPDQAGRVFSTLIADPERLLAWHTIFMAMTLAVVSRGVRGGLEKANKFLMPALFLLLLVMLGYAMNTGYFDAAVAFMFKPDFGKITGEGVMAAMGQAFFSLSLGMGAIMIYGSYLPQSASIARSSITIAAADTLVAILAGLVIFPIMFANGLESAQGPGLVFKTLPIAFGRMPGGAFFGMLFFVLLTFAAWTSAISIIEPAVAWLVENRGMKRVTATLVSGITVWLLGLGTIFSFNLWSDATLFGKTFFDLIDFLTSNIMLPLGGMFISCFAVWIMSREASREELELPEGAGYTAWRFLLRYITPLAVIIIFIHAIGLV
jgi:NSS family neurotransmitter:Na+ symporter